MEMRKQRELRSLARKASREEGHVGEVVDGMNKFCCEDWKEFKDTGSQRRDPRRNDRQWN